ncbi:MAG: hypothetical protein V1773_11905 [bacterium]
MSDNFDILFTLLKLKSFLLSMLENQDEPEKDFTFTREYLERKNPDRADEIIDILVAHNLVNDYDIAFNEKVHLIFKDIAALYNTSLDLNSILKKYDIETLQSGLKDAELEKTRIEKEQKIKKIVLVLFQTAKLWSTHNEIDNFIDNFSFLEDIDLIRPEEVKKLSELDKSSQVSFGAIKALTFSYINFMIDYLFCYGGDLTLKEFSDELEEVRTLINKKYNELFKSSGLKNI